MWTTVPLYVVPTLRAEKQVEPRLTPMNLKTPKLLHGLAHWRRVSMQKQIRLQVIINLFQDTIVRQRMLHEPNIKNIIISEELTM